MARPPPVASQFDCLIGPGSGRRLAINAADSLQLLALPGVGPVRAREILRARRRLGGFRTVGQLAEVKGIGPKTVERLRPLVCID